MNAVIVVVVVFGLLLLALAYVTSPAWSPRLQRWRNERAAKAAAQEEEEGDA